MVAARRRLRSAVLATVVCLWISIGQVSPQSTASVSYLLWTPAVIPSTFSGQLLVEVETSGTPSSATIDFNPAGTANTVVNLRDDGAGGDRRAGDRTWTAQLAVAPILAARLPDDANRVFIGFLNLYSGSTRTFRGNLFVDVHTPDVGDYQVTRLSQFMQATTRLVNIHHAAVFTARNIATVLRDFYTAFPDEYDVVNIVYAPMRFENRTHGVVKNTVSGIGLPISDGSASYGSAGRLLGISQFPIQGFYDGAETGFLHELGHQWVNHMRVAPFTGGVPHWPYSSMATGIMGFSIGGAGGQGGSFQCDVVEDPRGFILNPRTGGAPAYNDLDLYLMGLTPPEQVRDQFVFADQATSPRCDGSIYTGAMTRVRIADVIAALGPRTPAYGAAPTTFRTATILVTRDGLASPEMMSLYSWLTERAEWRVRVPTHSGFSKELGRPFHLATSGRGTLRVDINLRRPDFSVTAISTGEIVIAPHGGSFDAPVALSCEMLPANAACAFDPSAVTPGSETRTVRLSVATNGVAAGTHVVTVIGRSGTERHSTAVTVTVGAP
jgi:hypothetical protein